MIQLNIEDKLETTVKKLGEFSTRKIVPLETEYTENVSDKRALPITDITFKRFESPYHLFGSDKYYWFKTSFEIEAIPSLKAYLCIETFIKGDASPTRPQGLLFLNGELIQGIDINHTDVFLTSGKYEMYFLFYTHNFEHTLPLSFSIKYRDVKLNKLFYDLEVPLEAIKLLPRDSNAYIASITCLEKAINLLDLRSEYSSEFYKSVDVAIQYLQTEFYEKLCGSEQTVACVGHTHIDVAWLWTLAQTKEKTERSFSTVLKLMEEYPEYRFMASQPQLYEFLKEDNPILYKKVKEKVAEGRWEAEGAMWLEADCNLTSGESLVRQIVYGKQFLLQEFGVDSKVVWEPDVFGYSAALPQIMKKCGIDKFVTAKIGWNDTNRMPFDTFIWSGIDGSEVFTHLISTCSCNPRVGKHDEQATTYVGLLSPEHVLGTWNRYRPKEFNNTTLMAYGWGDGGGGPTREMLERQRRLQYGLPGFPKTKLSTLKDALQEIENNFMSSAEQLKRFPKWHGEIYLECHRGTYTSVPRVKRNNRKGELALQDSEFFSVFANKVIDETYPTKILKKDWKLLLLNQFHDILPGSSIKEVYRDSDAQYAILFKDTQGICNARLSAIAKNVSTNGGVIVFNSNDFCATGPITMAGRTHVVKAIPPLGYKVIRITETKCKIHADLNRRILENENFKIAFDKTGSIVSLFDKRFGREVVKRGEKLNEFRAYEDMPYFCDNWEITPYYKQKEWRLEVEADFQYECDGDRAGFTITKKYYRSTIKQTIYLYDGLARIDFTTKIEWKEKRQLLKIFFPFALNVDKATYDIQFGNIERPTHDNTSWDAAKFECVGQKWVDMSENNYGCALLSEDKYGYGAEGNILSLTILKSGSYPYDEASEEIPEFTYSLYPHGGDFRNGGVIEAAYLLNRPMFAVPVPKQKGILPETCGLIVCEAEGVYIETVKQAENEDGIVIRMYEAFRENKNVELKFCFAIKEAYLCNMLEQIEQVLFVEDNKVQFPIAPFEIVTLKVK